MKKASVLFAILLLFAGCHKVQTQVVTPVLPPGPADDELAYKEGLAAFRLATPEGYQHAVIAFRKASELKKDRCEYTMHLAEALYFLAQQQKLNWEDFSDSVGEANAIVEFRQGAPQCSTFTPYLARLRALRLTFENVPTTNAVTAIRQAIEMDPNDPLNWVVLSQLNPSPRNGEALAPIERASELDPELPLVQYELGNFYLRNDKAYEQARNAFEHALEMSPRHFQSIIGIVYSLSPEGDDAADRIEDLLNKAVDIAPASLKARTLLGDYYAGMEETEKAIEQYSAAIQTNAKFYPAELAEGTTLVTADRPVEAESLFKAVIELEVMKPHPPFNGVDYSADAQAHYYVGNIWLERGDLTRARAEYTESLDDIGSYGGPMYGLGIVSYREGKVDEALGYLDKVIQLNATQFPNAYLARGGIRAERRQFIEALADFNSAIQIYQQQSTALENRIHADETRGRDRRAEGERKRKDLIDATLQKALESRQAVEKILGGPESGHETGVTSSVRRPRQGSFR
jgi:tetratricopeptide (TPR) repeat protein